MGSGEILMNYRLVYEDKDGLKVVIPSPRWCKENNYNLKALADKLKLKDYSIININNLPVNRKFRSAWTLTGDIKTKRPTVTCCPERARAVLRGLRNLKLSALDMKALAAQRGSPDKLEGINNKAQELRDLPLRFNDDIKDLEAIYNELIRI